MRLDAPPSISAAIGTLNSLSAQTEQTAPTTSFASWLDGEIAQLDSELKVADHDLRDFAVGESRNIHHVMMSLEKAGLSFQLAVQMRNKVLEAYQEIMRMQV